MDSQLIIRPDSFLCPTLYWSSSRLAAEEQPGELRSAEELATLASHQQAGQVCLVIPACETLFRRFTLPKGKHIKTSSLLTWMAEESLPDSEDLHWTVIRHEGNNIDAVAVSQTWLNDWLRQCRDAGLTVTRIVPDASLLEPGTLACLGQQWLLCYDNGAFAEVDAGMLADVVAKMPDATLRSLSPLPADLPREIEVQPGSSWHHLVQRLNQSTLTLLPEATPPPPPRWRNPATWLLAAVFYSLLLAFIVQATTLYSLSAREQSLNAQAESLYYSYFPDTKIRGGVKYQFDKNSQKEVPSLPALISQLSQSSQTVGAFNVINMAYQAKPYSVTLNIAADNTTTLEALKKKLMATPTIQTQYTLSGNQARFIIQEKQP